MPPTADTSASSDDGSEASFHTSRKSVARAAAPHRYDLDGLYRDLLTARAEDFGDLQAYTDRLAAVRGELARAGEHVPDRLFFKKVELGARAAHDLTVNLALAICNKRKTRTSDELIRQLLAVDKLLEAKSPAAPAAPAAATTATTAGGGPTERRNFHAACGKFHAGGDEKCWVIVRDKKDHHPNFHLRCGNVHAGGDGKCWVVHPELRPKRAGKSKTGGGGGDGDDTGARLAAARVVRPALVLARRGGNPEEAARESSPSWWSTTGSSE